MDVLCSGWVLPINLGFGGAVSAKPAPTQPGCHFMFMAISAFEFIHFSQQFEAHEAVFGVFDDGASLSVESEILATTA
jgi:hypothetical protein